MQLRKLRLKDASHMLSWMHDSDVTKYMRSDFSSKTIEDVRAFIRKNGNEGGSLNLAIASDKDVYMGTVSLKHIDGQSAEFAIVIRPEAMGKGYAWYGMESILAIAFNDLQLESVYWCVSKENVRAIRFYDKHNFREALDIPLSILNRYSDFVGDLKWYSVLRGDTFNVKDMVAGCHVISINTVPTVNAGELSFLESFRDAPFEIKRIYYISKVPEGVRRGFHAHKKLKQLIFCPYGRVQLILDNQHGREEIELSDPSVGVLINEPTWREMLWLQKDSVLCVVASDYYDPSDYIRDYNVFRQYIDVV